MRIRHVYHSKRKPDDNDWADMPRGWIDPDGRFRPSKLHWESIRAFIGKKAPLKKKLKVRQSRDSFDTEDAEALGERAAQLAYSLGWISVSHGGVLNAVGHKKAFHSKQSPALATLRRLLARVPHSTVRIETQFGEINPETGRHEDFDVQEYELSLFVRRGSLRKVTY